MLHGVELPPLLTAEVTATELEGKPGDARQPFLVVLEPRSPLDLITWARACRQELGRLLLNHGGILLRGFEGPTARRLEELAETVSGRALPYQERSSPRTRVAGNVYTSTEHPAHQRIFFHNELSYNLTFPLKIFFSCMVPAEKGGGTPVADVRRVYRLLDPEIRRRFEEKRYLYVRNLGGGIGLPWQEVFQTSDRSDVEAYCRQNQIETTWLPDGRLRTRQVRPAVARHPHCGEMVWFNHVAFFHPSTLDKDVREALTTAFSEDDLPNNTYYGDGTTIEPSVLDEIRGCYEEASVRFNWHKGDILLLDNMLTAHGRESFSGPRRVLTVMTERCSWEDLR